MWRLTRNAIKDQLLIYKVSGIQYMYENKPHSRRKFVIVINRKCSKTRMSHEYFVDS